MAKIVGSGVVEYLRILYKINDIIEAINGLSTKTDAGRGFGLKTSLKLLTKGLHGECLIISGEED